MIDLEGILSRVPEEHRRQIRLLGDDGRTDRGLMWAACAQVAAKSPGRPEHFGHFTEELYRLLLTMVIAAAVTDLAAPPRPSEAQREPLDKV
jgi:hypothetical protein